MSAERNFQLAFIGGILVLITGIVELLYGISVMIWNLSYIGILFGLFMVFGSLMMKYRPHGINSKVMGLERTSKFPIGGFICLICSLVSLTFLQGFLIGPMMGILASTSNYSEVLKSRK